MREENGSGHEASVDEMDQLKNRLRVYENRCSLFLRGFGDAVYIFPVEPGNVPGKFEEVNEAACSMLGYSREAFLEMSPLDIEASTPTPSITAILGKLSLNQPQTFITAHKSRTGRNIPVELSIHLFAHNGKTMAGSIARRTTDSDLQKTAPGAEQEKYKAVFENAGIGMDLVDNDGRFIEVNAALARMLGYTQEELQHMTIHDVTHPDDKEISDHYLQGAISGSFPSYRIEKRYRRKDGTTLWADLSVSAVRDSTGRHVSTIGVIQDITHRKQTEDVLRAKEVKYRTLVENAGDAIYVAQEGTLIYLNSKTEEISGYTEQELKSRPFIEFIHPDDRAMVLERHIRRQQGEDLPSQYSFRIVRRSGEIRWVELNVVCLEWEGKNATLNFVSDITERKQAEDTIARRLTFERLLSRISSKAVKADNLREFLDDCLADMCGTLGATQAHLFEHCEETDTIDRISSMRADGRSLREVPHGSESDSLPSWWTQELRNGRVIRCDDVERISDDETRAYLHRGNILSVLAVPLFVGKSYYGFVRFDICGAHYPWPRECLELLPALSGIMSGVIERRRADEAIQTAEETYRTIFLNSQIGLFRTDMKTGLMLDANDAVAQFAGYKDREELLADRFNIAERYVDPDDRQRMISQLEAKGEIRNFEAPFKKNDGSVILMRFSGRVHHDKGWIEGVSEDITERKLAEEALRESILRYELVLEGASGGIWDWDVAKKRVHFSSSWKAMRGYDDNEIGTDESEWSNRIHPDDAPRIMEGVRAHFAGESPFFEEEYRVHCKDGSYKWVLARGKVFRDATGRVVRMAGSEIDITERKRAEAERVRLQAQLTQAQKMESVGRLAGGVAHDFNNMLGVILGHTEMALAQTDPAHPLFARLHEIQKAAQRSADLTRQLLAFARRQTISPKVLDLNETVEGMLRMLRRLIGEDIDLAWHPGRNLWPVRMDPSQIDQILANLCINARDAIACVGKVTIKTGKANFDEEYCAGRPGLAPGEYVLLSVADNGCGMERATLANLFEPFFTTKEMGKGTGLGLATVYGIVKQNNGFIEVHSEKGLGTVFKLYLPKHEGVEEPPNVECVIKDVARGHETILLVEDETAILEMAKTMLERLGYRVIAAATPSEAIRLAEELTGEIDLLMTDVVMPEMNGRELAERLLALRPHLKSLFTSGYTADVIAHHGVLDKGVNFIQKPFLFQDLAFKLRELLS